VLKTIQRHDQIEYTKLLRNVSYALSAAKLKAILADLVRRKYVGETTATDGRMTYAATLLGQRRRGGQQEPEPEALCLTREQMDAQSRSPLLLPDYDLWVYLRKCCVAYDANLEDAEGTALCVKETVLLCLDDEKRRLGDEKRRLEKIERLEMMYTGRRSDQRSVPAHGTAYLDVKRRAQVYSPLRRRWADETHEEIVRQTMVCLLVNNYGYSLEQLDEEVLVTGAGSGQARADLVVWSSAEDKAAGRAPLVVVECKAAGVPMDEEVCRQAENYARLAGAEYLALYNSRQMRCWRVVHGMMPKHLEEVNDIPRNGAGAERPA